MAESSRGPGVNAKQLEIIRQLAAREAARRQSQADVSRGKAAAAATSANGENGVGDAAELDAKTLESIVGQEKARNDVAWAKVKEQTDVLSERRSSAAISDDTDGAQLRVRETELAALDFEIERLAQELPSIEVAYSDGIAAILTRSTMASAIEQYEGAVSLLQSELADEQDRYDDDATLLRQLEEMRTGLTKRKEVLLRRQDSNDFASVERLDKMDAELAQLLRSLIDASEQLFADEDEVQGAQLRHLTDRLINKAWDTPADPYVKVSDDYLPAIPAFLLRANVAIEHPRDAQRLRLIEFQRMTGA